MEEGVDDHLLKRNHDEFWKSSCPEQEEDVRWVSKLVHLRVEEEDD